MDEMAVENTNDKNVIGKIIAYYIPLIQADAIAEYEATLHKQETIQRLWKEWREVGQTPQQFN